MSPTEDDLTERRAAAVLLTSALSLFGVQDRPRRLRHLDRGPHPGHLVAQSRPTTCSVTPATGGAWTVRVDLYGVATGSMTFTVS